MLGAIIGNNTGDGNKKGDARQGAVVGALIGGALGGGIGNYMDRQEAETYVKDGKGVLGEIIGEQLIDNINEFDGKDIKGIISFYTHSIQGLILWISIISSLSETAKA